MLEIIDMFFIQPVIGFFTILILLYNLLLGIFHYLMDYYPTKIIKKGSLAGEMMLDAPNTLLISTCFWLLLALTIIILTSKQYG